MKRDKTSVKPHSYLPLIFLLFIFLPAKSYTLQNSDSVYLVKRQFTPEEIIRGERLFYGLISQNGVSVNCAACHTTKVLDTLNWNPDAYDISYKYQNKTAKDLDVVLLHPTGEKMASSHESINLTPEDIILLKAYMDRFVDIGLKEEKPVITNLLLFIAATLLFLVSAIDLVFTKKIKRKWINFSILSITLIYITWILAISAIDIGRSQDYSPFQPIKFSHAVHAGQNEIDCIYCHSYAPGSKSAGIPAENVCMNCHLLVRNGSLSGRYEISKLIELYDNEEPIPWVRVYNLPDHVFFSHAQHVEAGKLNCSECHGEVEKMNVIKQVPDLSMGWCIDCHRNKIVDFDGNSFYAAYDRMADRIKNGITDSVTISMLGGTDCMKCHY